MNRKSLKVRTGNKNIEVEYWKLGDDAYLIEQKLLLIFINTKLGPGVSALPVKSDKISFDNDQLADIKKAFTILRSDVAK